jgi:predicted porin
MDGSIKAIERKEDTPLKRKKELKLLKRACLLLLGVLVLHAAIPWAAQCAELQGRDWLLNIGGALRASYNQEDCDGTCRDVWHQEAADAIASEGSDTYLSNDISQVAVSGSRRMDSGIKALFFAEWRIDTPEEEGGDIFSNYEQYLGLDGSFGLLRVGTIETPYMQTGKMLDPFTSDALSTRFFVDIQSALQHGTGKGRGRSTNTLRYDAPISAGGFGVQAFISIDNSDDSDDGHGAGITYTSKGMQLFVQYYDNGESGDNEAYKIGGWLGSETFALFGQYEFDKGLISLAENLSSLGTDDTNTAINDNTYEDNHTTGADVWFAGASYTSGKLLFIFEYGERKNSSGGRSRLDGHTGWLAGVRLMLDKNFYFYAGYLEKAYNADGLDKDSRYTVGATLTF